MMSRNQLRPRSRQRRLAAACIACLLLALLVLLLLAAEPLPNPATATRRIAPVQVAPGETSRVQVEIEAVQDIIGMGLDESLLGFPPEWGDWLVGPVENAGATYEASETEWVWLQIAAGETMKLVYDVTPPADAPPGSYQIDGTLRSQQPAFQASVEGDTTIVIAASGDPAPVTWATAPHATGCQTIAMEASTADQATGVQYRFEETTGRPARPTATGKRAPLHRRRPRWGYGVLLPDPSTECVGRSGRYRVVRRSLRRNADIRTGGLGASSRCLRAEPRAGHWLRLPDPNPGRLRGRHAVRLRG